MNIVLRVILILLSLSFNVLVLNMVRVGRAELRYALAWLGVGLVMLVLSVWPRLLNIVARLMNVSIPLNAAFFLAILFLLSILMGLTVVVSGHKSRIYKLTQLVAIQEKRIAELEKKLAANNAALPESGEEE